MKNIHIRLVPDLLHLVKKFNGMGKRNIEVKGTIKENEGRTVFLEAFHTQIFVGLLRKNDEGDHTKITWKFQHAIPENNS